MIHKIGLIGYGHMGKNHARIINKNEDAELVGIYDEKSESMPKKVAHIFNSLEEIISNSDTLVISTPTISHSEILKLCIENNKNALIEKPISTNLNEIIKIKELISNSENFYKVGLLEKFNPAVNYLSENKIEDIEHISIKRLSPSNQTNRNSDHVLMDLTIHDFSILTKILKEKFVDIDFDFFFKESDPENHVDIIGATKNFNVLISTSKIYHKKIRSIEITTRNETYIANLINNSVEIISNNEISFLAQENNYGHVENTQTSFPVIENIEPLVTQLKYFLNEIDNGNIKKNHKEFNTDIELHSYLLKQIK